MAGLAPPPALPGVETRFEWGAGGDEVFLTGPLPLPRAACGRTALLTTPRTVLTKPLANAHPLLLQSTVQYYDTEYSYEHSHQGQLKAP